MSKAMSIIGIVLGGIVAGVLTGGAAAALFPGAIAFISSTGGIAIASYGSMIGWGVGVITAVGGTLSTVAGWSGASGSAIGGGSPTYTWGKLQTQTSNCLAIPIIYGQCKVAGNTIWQDGSGTSELKKLVALADGEIEAIEDVRINNKAVGSLSGCSHNAYRGTSTQSIDGRVTGANNLERSKKVGGLRNTAYIALTAKASNDLAGGVNLTTVVKGSKIKVYSDLANYAVQYSNNPAWCILDFLTRYNGAGIPLEEIDLQSFIDTAAYCDQMVGEAGKQQKRFTLNLVLDEKKSRLDWLENMLITCRGYTFYQNGKLSLQIEKAENSMQMFDKDNILAGSEKFWTTPREKKVDIFKIQYIDPNNEYARIFAHAESEEFENEQPVVQEVQAWGVTNFNQASRLAWYYLNQAKTCDKFISFTTSQSGLDRTIGDVIEITSTFLGYENKKMRIVHMAEAQEGQIEIVCKEYNPNLYSDQVASANPVINKINLPNAFDAPPTPQGLIVDENCWRTPEGNYISTIKVNWDALDYFHLSHYEISYSDDNGETWSQGNIAYSNSFVIQNTKIDAKYLIKVQAVTNRNIFSEPVEVNILTVGKNNPPDAVKEFVIIQKGNMLKAVIIPPDDPDIDYYEIRKGLSWEDSEFVCTFLDKTTTFRATELGTVSYLIKTIDNVGNYSETALRSNITISGLTPKNIVIEQIFEKADFIDIEFGNEKLLPIIDLGRNFEDYRSPQETCLWAIFENPENYRGIEYRSGFTKFEGWNYLVYDEDVWEDDKNEIVWFGWKTIAQSPSFRGQYLQVKIISKIDDLDLGDIRIVASVENIEDIEDVKELQNAPVALDKSFAIPPSLISLTNDAINRVKLLPIMDMGRNFEDPDASKETYILTTLDNPENYEVEYRNGFAKFTGWDNLTWKGYDESGCLNKGDVWEDKAPIIWSDWKTITSEPSFIGQYLQLKITSKSDGFDLKQLQVITDVEDVEDTIYNIDIQAHLTTIQLNKNFTIPPMITPVTTDSTGKVCAWRISNIKKRYFDIELFDKDNNLIAGKLLEATARGY